MREYIFDDFGSLWHMLLGFLVPFIALLNVVPAIGVLATFATYEAVERENPVSTIGDFMEFTVGFMAGVLVVLSGYSIL